MGLGIKWLVGLLLASVLLFGIGASYRWTYERGIEHQKNVDIVAIQQANKDAQIKYDSISKELEDERNKSKVVYKTITRNVDKIVDRPVYTNVCIDDAGMQLYNSALRGEESTDPNGTSTGVPATNPANGKDGS